MSASNAKTDAQQTLRESRPMRGRLEGHDIILCCDCEGTQGELYRMWQAIENAGVAANFFFVGQTTLDETELVREIASRHQVDSHTMHHPNLRRLSKEDQREAIMSGRQTVENIIQRQTRGFRAPYHCLNRMTVEILNEEGFTFDASCLYFRYNLGAVEGLTPTWFREWMPFYDRLGLSPQTTFGIFRTFAKYKSLSVLPAHPQYSGRDARLAEGFEDFLKWGVDQGVTFWPIDAWLHLHRDVPLPSWMPPTTPSHFRPLTSSEPAVSAT